MNVRLTLVVTSIVFACTNPAAKAVTSIKKVNLLHNASNSPFFTKNAAGGNLLPYTTTDLTATFTPVGTVQAGQVTSLVSNGSFSFTGNSTSAGGWTDGNGIPAGITLTFNTQFTIGMPASTPAGYVLTNSPTAGNGIGIAQTAGVTSTIDSPNQTDPTTGFCCESLVVSAMSVSIPIFSGSLAEPGYSFIPGTVGNFGPYVIQAADFKEQDETFGLWSETGPPDPLGLNRPTIGFGVPKDPVLFPSEAGRGEGVVASHVSMENSFGNVNGDSTRLGFFTTWFDRQIGGWTFTAQNAKAAVKGIGYEYDVNFTIIPPGDYSKNGFVDAADYVTWRQGNPAADSNGDTLVDEIDYDYWRARFGNPTPGAGARLSDTSVPEPGTLMLTVVGMLAACSWRRIGRKRS